MANGNVVPNEVHYLDDMQNSMREEEVHYAAFET